MKKFLQEFKTKMRIWSVLFRDDRGKNAQCLVTLEITSLQRKKVLEELEAQDYSQGPISDQLHHGPQLWVFGRQVKKQEVYIKITMGLPSSGVICISFHLAEHPMRYPLKEN